MHDKKSKWKYNTKTKRSLEERTSCLGSWQRSHWSGYTETDSWSKCVSFYVRAREGIQSRWNSLASVSAILKTKTWRVQEVGSVIWKGFQNFMGSVLFVWGEISALITLLFMTQVDSLCKKYSVNISDQLLSACGLGIGRDQGWDGWRESDAINPILLRLSQDVRH